MASMSGPQTKGPDIGPVEPPLNHQVKPAPDIQPSTVKTTESKTRTADDSSVASANGSSATNQTVLSALFSPAFVAGVGNALFISTLGSPILTGVYASLAVMSFINRLYPISIEQGATSISDQPSPNKKNERGLLGWLKERYSLPGVCLDANGVAFALTALACAVKIVASAVSGNFSQLNVQDLAHVVTCAFFSVGDFSGACLCNAGVARREREPWRFEESAKKLWSCLPAAVRSCLANPGAMFSLGNLPLYAATIYTALSLSESVSSAQIAVTALGGSFTLAGATFGVLPLFLGTSKWQKPLPLICNSTGNALMGIAMITAGVAAGSVGSVIVGLAAVAWAWTNGVYTWQALRGRSSTEGSTPATPQ
jgi:hypothetical protein